MKMINHMYLKDIDGILKKQEIEIQSQNDEFTVVKSRT